MKKKVAFATLAAATAALVGCTTGGGAEEIMYEPKEFDRYRNHIEIEGQWGASAATGANGQYGIGDPFVMRYNGKYYLYPSTSDPCDGIKVFESDDLVNWTYKGFAVAESEPTVHGAYAPEVVYYDGYFYLCQSRAGKGHYIYRSESPTEGFVLVSKSENVAEGNLEYGNLGMGIDGSFYVSDEGKLYLLHTSTPAGLKFNEITDVNDIRPSTIGAAGTLGDANLRHWIEGPGIFRRGETTYLTYTGNHVISKGYRVAYSYAENPTDLSSFTQPADNVTIIDTADEHYGLGHSSNVNGPDLDSVYTAYHSLVGNGPARRYNVDRYLASGRVLTANGVTYRPVAVPSRPDAEAKDGSALTAGNGFVLGTTGDYFTAEYNFVPAEGQEIFFGRTGEKAYFVRVNSFGISLVLKTAKGESVLAQKALTVPAGRLAAVRVENGDGVGYVYFNSMRVLSYEAGAAAGETGFASADGVGYTAFTNDVFGTSDFEAVKNFPTKFPAISYLKGEMRGFKIAGAKQVAGGARVGEKQSVKKIADANAVSLKKGDWVKYAIDVPENGVYFIGAEVSAASAGAQLKITIEGEELLCTLPAAAGIEGESYKVSLGNIAAKAGVTSMKVEVVSGSADLILFEVEEGAQTEENVSLADFEKLRGDVRYEDGTLTVTGSSGNGVALWGGKGISDFEVSLSFRSNAAVGTDFGIMLRENHYSYYPDQPAQSWRGYYLALGAQMMSLSRYDYGDELLGAVRTQNIGDGGEHTLEIRAKSHSITVVLDGVTTLTATDGCAFLSGRIGVYAASGTIEILKVSYKNI